MESVLLAIHLITTLALIVMIMLQRSEGGGLGIGGGGGGMGALAGAHATANILTRGTAILATIFFVTNLSLAYMAKVKTSADSVISEVVVEGEAPVVPVEGVEDIPAAPVVPIAD